jgi:hypothetical protein
VTSAIVSKKSPNEQNNASWTEIVVTEEDGRKTNIVLFGFLGKPAPVLEEETLL